MTTNRDVPCIYTRSRLQRIAKALGVRQDWHEPDEQGVTARVFGKKLDNAGFWGLAYLFRAKSQQEIYIVLYKDKKPFAQVNLADLFSFACGREG